MRNLRLLAVAAVLAVSACETSTPVTPATIGGETREETVRTGRQYAENICNFVPTAKTILEILDLGLPNISKGAVIAEKICGVIQSSGKNLSPTYMGVPIEGTYK